MQWQLGNNKVPQNSDELKQILLETRQIADSDLFFHPTPPSQLTLAEMELDASQLTRATSLILEAIDQQRKILVFGDYDADGITATSLVWLALHQLGAKVFPFIPDRHKHGYGISDRSLDDILSQGKPDLIITVDNGIVAHQAIERVKAAGIQVIISDHHLPEMTAGQPKYPPADAIVHSTQLCGASVGWVLVRELFQAWDQNHPDETHDPDQFLDLAGIGTIADQVPLLNANRSFAKFGLQALRQTTRLGLVALFESAGIQQAEIDTYHVNFTIAPRINAMGRLEQGMDALRLLCSQEKSRAQQRAQMLTNTNSRRQDLTLEMVESAKTLAEDWQNDHLIFVAADTYHEGVIGLIAGKLVEEYGKPAIVASISGEVVKASARSVPGINIIELIRQVKDDLLEAGGHPMAAGFGLETKKLDQVTQRLRQIALDSIDVTLLQPKLKVDCVLPVELINLESCQLIQQFAPFGQGNFQPVFGVKELTVLDVKPIGRDRQHLKLLVKGQSEEPFTCLAWNYGQLVTELSPGQQINIAGSLQINSWHDRQNVQMSLKDFYVK